MSTPAEEIRTQQQATWNEFSAGWKKWDDVLFRWQEPAGLAMLDGARLQPTSHVLDIASGTGEPALSAAARCPQGRVVMTDLAENMLAVALDNAARRGLRNVETRQCDAAALPFPDDTFDAVTARFGFMFFPDMVATARELRRVAKPGARICAAVWGAPEKNPWSTTTMATIARNVDLPAPPPGAPGLFRCAAPGFMAGIFRDAGLTNVTEQEVGVVLEVASPEDYFSFMTEVAAPVVAGMARADAPTRARIKDIVIGLARQSCAGGKTRLAGAALVVCADK
jgi:ubiquinone/menaquinone biosynthesis C-methylase UbiE